MTFSKMGEKKLMTNEASETPRFIVWPSIKVSALVQKEKKKV